MAVSLCGESSGPEAVESAPLSADRTQMQQRLQSARSSVPPVTSDRHRVLIAEDDAAVRTTMTEILTTEGYSVTTASDGEEALAALRSQSVDILVLDLHMPVLDGVGVLERIDAPPPYVVVHSAFEYYNPRELKSLLGTKIFGYLRKPVAPSDLMRCLREAAAQLREGDES